LILVALPKHVVVRVLGVAWVTIRC
jgi:hypothetical protein